MKRVLVLDANQRAALAVTRSLGLHGLEVITADTSPETLAGASRYSQLQLQYPPPALQPDDFLEKIITMIRDHKIDVVMPVTDITTYLLVKNRTALNCALPCPSFESYEKLSDKSRLFRLAEKLDLPVPRTIYLENSAEADMIIGNLSFPLVIKPFRSKILEGNKFISTSVKVATTMTELTQLLAHTAYHQRHPFMLQEFIAGEGQGIFALYNNGKPVTFFSHKRIREKPPEGGVSVLSESTPLAPRLHDCATKLLDAANWHGPAMVEFKVAADGTPYLMEVNGRYWGSLQLAIDAGIDFPFLAYQMASTICPVAPSSYRFGLRNRWLLGDLDRLYLVLKGPCSMTVKLREVMQFLMFFQRNTKYEINRISDLRPFIVEVKQYIRSFFPKAGNQRA